MRPAHAAGRAASRRRRPWRALLGAAASLAIAASAAAGGLSLSDATELAREQSPSLRALRASVAGSTIAQPAAAALPDPRLLVGVDNLPVEGPDRYSFSRDPGTMQRLGVMQEVPNRAKRDARLQLAQARTERDRLQLAAAELGVRREAMRAWVAVYYAQQRLAWLDRLQHENGLLQQTLPSRIAAGQAPAAELTMARQEALAIADRHDELARDLAKARAALRRLIGVRADETLTGEPPAWPVDATALRGNLHRHTELAPYDGLLAMGQAEVGESESETPSTCRCARASARRRRSRRGARRSSASRPSARTRRGGMPRRWRRNWPNCRRSTPRSHDCASKACRWPTNAWPSRWPATGPGAANSPPCWPRAAACWNCACARWHWTPNAATCRCA